MNRIKYLSLLVLQIIFVFSLFQCNCKTVDLCCHQYEGGSDSTFYCNNHRDAVGKFIREGQNLSEQKIRLENFKQFYESVKDCSTLECIETKIDNNLTLPGFKERYETEHIFADSFMVDLNIKAELVLCGFEHAIVALSQTLNEQDQ